MTAKEKLKAVRKTLMRYASDPAMVPLINDLLDIIDAEDADVATTCQHGPSNHEPRPFWFADQMQPEDHRYSPERPVWKAFLQLDGVVVGTDLMAYSEADCLQFIRDDILKATTVCDQ